MPHITIATQATCIDSIVTGGLEVVLKVIFLIPFNLAKVPFFSRVTEPRFEILGKF